MTQPSPRALVVLLLLAGLVAGALWHFLPEGEGGPDAGPSLGEAPVQLATLGERTDATLDEGAASLPDEDALRSSVEGSAEASSSGPLEAVVAGTVVIEELDGSSTLDATGTLTLILWHGNSGSHHELEVSGGKWQLNARLDADGSYTYEDGAGTARQPIDRVAVGEYDDLGRAVVRTDRDQEFELGELAVVIEVRRVASLQLEVVDAATGEGLTGVSVVAEKAWGDGIVEHPGDGRDMTDLVVAEDSPVELQPSTDLAESGRVGVLVGARGYAWKKVELDLASGGERRVRLERGGDLVVHFDRALTRRDAELHVTDTGRGLPVAMQQAKGAGPFSYQGLPPGTYEVSVEIGEWWSDQLALASETVVVEAGGSASVTLVLEEAPVLTRAPFSGLLILPASYGVTEPLLIAELEGVSLDGGDGYERAGGDQLERVEGTSDAWSFDFGMLQTGRYELRCNGVEYQVKLDLGPGGATDYRFQIPEPVPVCVTVRDVDTGELADVDGLFWHYEPPEGWSGGMSQGARREPGQSDICFSVPPGTIVLSHSAEDYVHVSTTFQAFAGARVTLEVRRAGEAVLRLVQGETTLPWPENDYGVGKRLDDEGDLGSRSHRHGGLWFKTAPGRYQVEVPHIEGFEDHPPVELTLVAGERAELDIELVKLP
ncbi:MAG: hypothetical protein P1V81_04970 [Planctomycetota bacterium]|nr:hypothetical protein [Planctomycetota bacterium]